MELCTEKNQHAQYNLQYHLVLVTKYRKPCITPEMFRVIEGQLKKVAEGFRAEVEEISFEPDHVHLLMQVPPQVSLSVMVNSMKSTSSRLVRKLFAEPLSGVYRKPVFWNRSYLILSSGGAPIDVIQEYIREQGTQEHAAKTARRKKRLSPPEP